MNSLSRRSFQTSALAGALGLTIPGLIGSASAQAVTPAFTGPKIKAVASYGQLSLQNAPIWISKEKGFCDKYGLDTELVQLSGTRLVQGMLSNSVQFIASTATSTFNARFAGADTLMVACYLASTPYDIFGGPKVLKPEDAKGKVAAVDLRGDFSQFVMTLAMKKYGINPDTDITFVQGFSADPDRIGAVLSGSADMSMCAVEYRDKYRQAGLHTLVSVLDLKIPFITRGIFTTGAYAKKNPEAVQRYIMAISEAVQFFKNNRDESLDVCAKYMLVDPKSLYETYEIYKSAFLVEPSGSTELVKASLAPFGDDPRALAANPADFFDNSFVAKLDQAGFFKKITG